MDDVSFRNHTLIACMRALLSSDPPQQTNFNSDLGDEKYVRLSAVLLQLED